MKRETAYRVGILLLLPVCIALAWSIFGSTTSVMVTMSVDSHAFHAGRYSKYMIATGGIDDAALERVILDQFAHAFAERGWERTESAESEGTVVLGIRPGPVGPMTEKREVAGQTVTSSVGCSLKVELKDRGAVVWVADLATSGDHEALADMCSRMVPEIAAAFPEMPQPGYGR